MISTEAGLSYELVSSSFFRESVILGFSKYFSYFYKITRNKIRTLLPLVHRVHLEIEKYEKQYEFRMRESSVDSSDRAISSHTELKHLFKADKTWRSSSV